MDFTWKHTCSYNNILSYNRKKDHNIIIWCLIVPFKIKVLYKIHNLHWYRLWYSATHTPLHVNIHTFIVLGRCSYCMNGVCPWCRYAAVVADQGVKYLYMPLRLQWIYKSHLSFTHLKSDKQPCMQICFQARTHTHKLQCTDMWVMGRQTERDCKASCAAGSPAKWRAEPVSWRQMIRWQMNWAQMASTLHFTVP